jgi:tRNA-splicing endonuclease subunit Sen2
LSRSEPAWLDAEKNRRGGKAKQTSEEATMRRRAERQETKWERARKEREAIDQKLLEEAESAIRENKKFNIELVGRSTITLVEETKKEDRSAPEDRANDLGVQAAAPVGPLELLALPNSDQGLYSYVNIVHDDSIVECFEENFDEKSLERFQTPPVGPLELLALPNSIITYLPLELKSESNPQVPVTEVYTNGYAASQEPSSSSTNSDKVVFKDEHRINGHTEPPELEIIGGSETNDETGDDSTHSEESIETNGTPSNGSVLNDERPSTPKMKHRKSVRFSPTVEKNTFIQSEPPSTERVTPSATVVVEQPLIIKEQEHLQVTLEEAFFLSYALGALKILDPETKSPISNEDLFYLFRKTSYFPPRANPSLSPDDPFMVNYIVYHHFRSLGWVVRSGIKFSCDYMLYMRGPVFTHAEFCVLIIPSYTDLYWKSDVFLQNYIKGKENRTWAWMNCTNRVIGQVKKTLVLCYVDIPKPLDTAEEQKLGIDGILARYKVREVVMKRFVSTRMRG